MVSGLCSVARVCEVEFVRGAQAVEDSRPDLVLEVPHGATRAAHFDELRDELSGDYDDGLRDFFFVNTDVGSPELAKAIADGFVAADPGRTAAIVRCLMPRTFLDTNRTIARDAVAKASKAGEMTPGLQPWVVHEGDRELLLERYFAYRDVVTAGFAAAQGRALCVHTYAPRSIDVAVDADIATALHLAYAPDRIGTWPLRAEVDLITHDPDGAVLADDELANRAEREFAAAGVQVVRNGTYALHPSTLAYEFAKQYPGRTLCFEVRRDLLLDEFVPFVELHPTADAVRRMAEPFVRALQP